MSNFRFIAILFILFVGCESDDVSEPISNSSRLLIHFDPRMNNTSVQLGELLCTSLDQTILVSDLNFYLSHIELINSSGIAHQLSEISYVNMRQNWRVLEFNIPTDDYTHIRFNLGVPSELNGTQNPNFTTSLYDSSHPLSASNGMYWAWEAGYRFFFFEGRCDTICSLASNVPLTFSLHTGRDTLYRTIPAFHKNFKAVANGTSTLNFAVDLDKIFDNDGQTIDLSTERQFHGAYAQLPLGIKLADNTAAAFRMIN